MRNKYGSSPHCKIASIELLDVYIGPGTLRLFFAPPFRELSDSPGGAKWTAVGFSKSVF